MCKRSINSIEIILFNGAEKNIFGAEKDKCRAEKDKFRAKTDEFILKKNRFLHWVPKMNKNLVP
jgi:hypothetical protein